MPALLANNPGLKLEVVATGSLVDILEGGFDAGIRPGERLSQDMIAVRIKHSFRFTVAGAPSYLGRSPALRTPHDLNTHDCVRYAFPIAAIFGWEFAKADWCRTQEHLFLYFPSRRHQSAGLKVLTEAIRA